MGVQKSINRFLGTIAGAAYVAARLSTNKYKKGTSASKKKYTEKVNTTKGNKNIQKNISERISSETKEEVPATQVATMADWFPETLSEEKPAEAKQTSEVKEKVSAFNEYLGEGAKQPISPENSKTKVEVDEDVGKLIEVRQKSLARSVAGQKSTNRYQSAISEAKELTGSQKEDVWNSIGLDVNITDEDIKKAGYSKSDIIEDFNKFYKDPNRWASDFNSEASDKGIDHVVNEGNDDYIAMQEEFGKAWSAKILDKKRKEEYQKAEEEHYKNLEKTENYFVWEPEDEEEDKDGEIVF